MQCPPGIPAAVQVTPRIRTCGDQPLQLDAALCGDLEAPGQFGRLLERFVKGVLQGHALGLACMQQHELLASGPATCVGAAPRAARRLSPAAIFASSSSEAVRREVWTSVVRCMRASSVWSWAPSAAEISKVSKAAAAAAAVPLAVCVLTALTLGGQLLGESHRLLVRLLELLDLAVGALDGLAVERVAVVA